MDVIGKRKIWYAISLILLLVSFGSLLIQGLNLGIDYTGGVLFQIKFEDQTIDSEKVRNTLAAYNLEKSSIQFGGDESYTIRTEDMDESRQNEVLQGLEEKLGKYEILRSEKVGPVFGSELRKAAILALAIASVLQIIYITFRFEFMFGITAIITVLHDAFVAMGLFSVLQLEVDGAFVAAILTIIGYSINDRIVIFDRIRENLRSRKKGEDLAALVNNSIKQSLTRSVNTGVSVIFVLAALLFLGGETTKNFALALLTGVISGCYASIFVASSMWYDLKRGAGKPKTAKAKA